MKNRWISLNRKRYYGDNISFEKEYSSIFFDAKALNYPLLQQDYCEGPDRDEPLQELFDNGPPYHRLTSMLKQCVIPNLQEDGVSIDKAVNKPNSSQRALQSRLADRQTNFLSVMQEVRSRAAMRYFFDKRLAISEVAFLLGYADQGAFSNAFKRWHGVWPRHFRDA